MVGYTADRCSYEQWFAQGKMTTLASNEKLPQLNLAPNHDLRARIIAFIQKVAQAKASNEARFTKSILSLIYKG